MTNLTKSQALKDRIVERIQTTLADLIEPDHFNELVDSAIKEYFDNGVRHSVKPGSWATPTEITVTMSPFHMQVFQLVGPIVKEELDKWIEAKQHQVRQQIQQLLDTQVESPFSKGLLAYASAAAEVRTVQSIDLALIAVHQQLRCPIKSEDWFPPTVSQMLKANNGE